MSSENYDVRDGSGCKIGTIEPSSGIGPLIFVLLAIVVIGIPIALIIVIVGAVAQNIHPAMPYTYFSALSARMVGAAVKYDDLNMVLSPRGSVEFTFNNEYSDGQSVSAIVIVNGINAFKLLDVPVNTFGKKLLINLHKGVNTIKIINKDQHGWRVFVGAFIYTIACVIV